MMYKWGHPVATLPIDGGDYRFRGIVINSASQRLRMSHTCSALMLAARRRAFVRPTKSSLARQSSLASLSAFVI
eukprot:6189667-Pleurochrysis_carterae.AAC.1